MAQAFEGRVYAYRLDNGARVIPGSQQELRASDSAPGAYFGWSLALSANGTAIAVGAVRADATRGRVYLFERAMASDGATTWNETTRLRDPDGAVGDRFGTSVALAAEHIRSGSNSSCPDSADTGVWRQAQVDRRRLAQRRRVSLR